MTHEQKPESAEFRTRDVLLPCPFCGAPAESLDFNDGENIGGSCISCTRCGASGHVEFGFKENFVSRWNTRINNATEQRRKDAEGAEPVAWLISDQLKGKPGCAHIVDRTTTNRAYAEYQATLGFDVTPLYTRPANVAALIAEAVAAERERCAKMLDASAIRADEQGAHWGERYAKCWAAAIREGGEK